VVGLKDRTGKLKLEVYPNNDSDFLMDDNVLVYQGKAFRRFEEETPASGNVQICIRVPSAGPYSIMLLHDRTITANSAGGSMASALRPTRVWAGTSPRPPRPRPLPAMARRMSASR
jgi:hypothetical protein